MPGIYEANGSETKTSEANAQLVSSVETLALNEQPSTTENDQPSQETDQTDKVNKFLLKSFLQHINNNSMNVATEEDEQNSDESDADWN